MKSWFDSRQDYDISLFTKTFKPAVGTTQSLGKWGLGVISQGRNRPEREAKYSHFYCRGFEWLELYFRSHVYFHIIFTYVGLKILTYLKQGLGIPFRTASCPNPVTQLLVKGFCQHRNVAVVSFPWHSECTCFESWTYDALSAVGNVLLVPSNKHRDSAIQLKIATFHTLTKSCIRIWRLIVLYLMNNSSDSCGPIIACVNVIQFLPKVSLGRRRNISWVCT